jgi:hypothetical protein
MSIKALLVVSKLALEHLTNEEHFNFITEVVELFFDDSAHEDRKSGSYSAASLGLTVQYTELVAARNREDIALELVRKSAITETMVDTDHKRDIAFNSLNDTLEAWVHHFNPAKRAAVSRVIIVARHYAALSHKTYAAQTSSMYNFVQELRTNYAADVALLGLDEFLNEIETLNELFKTLSKERYLEMAAKTDLRMKGVRRESDDAYRTMIHFLEAMITINGPTTYQIPVKDLNERVKKYDQMLAQRKGISGKKKNQADDAEDAPAEE